MILGLFVKMRPAVLSKTSKLDGGLAQAAGVSKAVLKT